MTVFCSESSRPRGLRKDRQGWFGFLFEYFLGCARLDKVIGITHEISFVASLGYRFDGLLHAIQREVGQQWGDEAALRSACASRKQSVLFPVSGFEPCPQKLLVHRDVLQQP